MGSVFTLFFGSLVGNIFLLRIILKTRNVNVLRCLWRISFRNPSHDFIRNSTACVGIGEDSVLIGIQLLQCGRFYVLGALLSSGILCTRAECCAVLLLLIEQIPNQTKAHNTHYFPQDNYQLPPKKETLPMAKHTQSLHCTYMYSHVRVMRSLPP